MQQNWEVKSVAVCSAAALGGSGGSGAFRAAEAFVSVAVPPA